MTLCYFGTTAKAVLYVVKDMCLTTYHTYVVHVSVHSKILFPSPFHPHHKAGKCCTVLMCTEGWIGCRVLAVKKSLQVLGGIPFPVGTGSFLETPALYK